jgi:hypothetical protein
VREILDFIAGRSNKLLRDLLGTGLAIIVLSFGALMLINAGLDQLRENRNSLPPKVAYAPVPQSQDNAIRTVTRSVLDDNITTGSIRPVILDPCTGKEKK